MKKQIDTTGKRFGKLTVLEEINVPYERPSERRKTTLKCRCKCDCGKEVIIYKSNLLYRKVRSCPRCQNITDLTGMTFGHLKVLKRDMSKSPGSFWFVKCKCGTIFSITQRFLIRNTRVACFECQPKGVASKDVFPKDINIGRKYGWLTIKKYLGLRLYDSSYNTYKGKMIRYYLVKCKCGNEFEEPLFIISDKKSCGCMRKDRKGEKNPRAVLSNKDAKLIRELHKNNPDLSEKYFAKIYNVSRATIGDLLRNRYYKDV